MALKRIASAVAALLALGGILLVPVGGGPVTAASGARPRRADLSAWSDAKPPLAQDGKPLRALFIHHSCGGQLLAPVGEDKERGGSCLYVSHPNGGGLRDMLGRQGYEVHEASYGSAVGDKTDMFDWLPKFKDDMAKVLTVDENDTLFTDGRKNQIVVFKSCYPNNRFSGEGTAPGNPNGPELTVWNAKAHLSALLPIFAAHPGTLFVYMTAPPNAPIAPKERLVKYLVKELTGRPHASDVLASQASLAREFNTWVASTDGWLAGYAPKNVVVFDYYDALTDEGASDLSRYASDRGADNHPTSAGNAKAASSFVALLNRAVRRAGLAEPIAEATP